VGHLVIGGDHVGQAGSAFHEPMLAGPDPLVVLHVPDERTQGEPLHNLTQLPNYIYLQTYYLRISFWGCVN